LVLKLDTLDVGIIEALQQDGRILYKDIAKKMGVSLPTARARINRLMDLGVIRKFTVIVDADKVYGKIRAFCLIQARPGKIEEICEKLGSMREVRETYVTAGSEGTERCSLPFLG
jgi:Lrp/AsnC family transcriptional regulator for asnA, asnC and gidA